jgi:hypothetical protein
MEAKVNSKTHLKTAFFVFFSRFGRVCPHSFQKVLIGLEKTVLAKIQFGYQKLQNLMVISNLLKKLQKNHAQKKSTKKRWKKGDFY